MFRKLTRPEITDIVELLLRRLREQVAQHEATIELTAAAKDLLVSKGYDPSMGARPLRRAIQRYIEDPLADYVLGRSLTPGATILIDHKEGEEDIDITLIEPAVERELVTVPADVGDGELGDDAELG